MKTNVTADAAVRLMLGYPFWSELYYSMGVEEDTTIPTLCTDGRNMWVNPDFWTTLKLDIKISALAHEIAHKMLLHSSRRGARSIIVQSQSGHRITLWNIAADHVVNNLLAENGFTIPDTWIMDKKYQGWSVEAVYSDLEKQLKQPPPQGQGKGEGEGAPGDDEGGSDPQNGQGDGDAPGHGLPGLTDDQAEKRADLKDVQGTPEDIQKYEQEVQQAVHKALMTAKAMGKLPAGVEMAIDAAFEAAEEPWYNHLHRFMQSLSVSEFNWARINKKAAAIHGIFAPHHYSEALGEVVVAIDASGSVYDAASQSNFAAHCNAILSEAKPEKIHLMYFDAKVHRTDEIDRGEIDFNYRPVGGGGTAFEPIFEEIEELGIKPVVVIVLTDLMGSFPDEAPGYPVIWASIERDLTAPFGETIYVE